MNRNTVATLAGLCFVSVVALAQPTASVWDGIYNEDQAKRGADDFAAHCASCHGADMSGTGEAPALIGAQFISDFNGETVGDLFDRIRTTMPQDNPGGLSRDQYAETVAFIFKSNGFPPGAKELDRRSEYLKAIAFLATNPHPAPAAAH
jgi:S-disulfanyl-L-cysteine oxidoreductase SoxD